MAHYLTFNIKVLVNNRIVLLKGNESSRTYPLIISPALKSMIYNSEPSIVKEWKIPSKKTPDIWTISLFDDARFSCDCPSFSYGGKHFCKHTHGQRSYIEMIYGNVNNYIKALKEKQDGK